LVISIDAMGGDHGPPVVIPAVVRAISALPQDVRFLLHGDEGRDRRRPRQASRRRRAR